MATHGFSKGPQETHPIKTKYRSILTPIPAPGTEAVLGDLERYESRSMHGQLPIVWDRATDFSVYDIAGNKWIDFTSTIFTANIGHANPRLVREIKRVLDQGLVHTYAYPPGRESVKIGPPLTIPDDALMEGARVLGEAISELNERK